MKKVLRVIIYIVLQDLERHGEVWLSGEGALCDNCHCLIRSGATWRRCFG